MKEISRIIALLPILLIVVIVIGGIIAFFYLPENSRGAVLGVSLALLNLLFLLSFKRYNDRRGNHRN